MKRAPFKSIDERADLVMTANYLGSSFFDRRRLRRLGLRPGGQVYRPVDADKLTGYFTVGSRTGYAVFAFRVVPGDDGDRIEFVELAVLPDWAKAHKHVELYLYHNVLPVSHFTG